MSAWKRWLVLFGMIICLLHPQFAEAHADLTASRPAADSHWEHSPPQVILTFSERLENELFDLKVRDKFGQSVANNGARLSDDRKRLMLDLPSLADGIFTVSYKVISADGHPVEGTYVFSVGTAQNPQSAGDSSLRPSLGGNDQFQWTSAVTFILRALQIFFLLAVAGWTLWTIFHRPPTEELLSFRLRWSEMLQSFYLLSLIAAIGVQIPELLDRWTGEQWLALLRTGIGISWSAGILLSIIGFVSLHRSKTFAII